MSSTLAIHTTDPRTAGASRTLSLPALAHTSSRRRADEIQFWVVCALTFPVFLLSTLVGRLVPGRPARAGRAGETPSIFQEAKASARTCGSFSLMG